MNNKQKELTPTQIWRRFVFKESFSGLIILAIMWIIIFFIIGKI